VLDKKAKTSKIVRCITLAGFIVGLATVVFMISSFFIDALRNPNIFFMIAVCAMTSSNWFQYSLEKKRQSNSIEQENNNEVKENV